MASSNEEEAKFLEEENKRLREQLASARLADAEKRNQELRAELDAWETRREERAEEAVIAQYERRGRSVGDAESREFRAVLGRAGSREFRLPQGKQLANVSNQTGTKMYRFRRLTTQST